MKYSMQIGDARRPVGQPTGRVLDAHVQLQSRLESYENIADINSCALEAACRAHLPSSPATGRTRLTDARRCSPRQVPEGQSPEDSSFELSGSCGGQGLLHVSAGVEANFAHTNSASSRDAHNEAS